MSPAVRCVIVQDLVLFDGLTDVYNKVHMVMPMLLSYFVFCVELIPVLT